MKFNRRNFMTGLAISAVGTALGAKSVYGKEILNIIVEDKGDIGIKNLSNKILPPALEKGSIVAFSSPASPTNPWEIQFGKKYYEKMGCKVVIGDTIKNQKNDFRYLAASDKARAEEFMNFVKDPTVNAIICGRGGFGSQRIIPYLNFDELIFNPKIIMGYSDITALLLAIFKKTNLVTFHGPVATETLNEFTKINLRNTIFKQYSNINYKGFFPNAITMVEGSATGEIIGGNLTMMTSLLGTEYEIETQDKILFIEDVAEHAYQIDRMIMQLILANKLQVAKAIIFGGFKNLNVRRPFYPNRGYTIKEVLEQHLKSLKIPSMVGIPFGHEDNKIILPFGINSLVDTKKKYFEILENSVI
jgi:muramoyltetrapeptide carboxypeptidase